MECGHSDIVSISIHTSTCLSGSRSGHWRRPCACFSRSLSFVLKFAARLRVMQSCSGYISFYAHLTPAHSRRKEFRMPFRGIASHVSPRRFSLFGTAYPVTAALAALVLPSPLQDPHETALRLQRRLRAALLEAATRDQLCGGAAAAAVALYSAAPRLRPLLPLGRRRARQARRQAPGQHIGGPANRPHSGWPAQRLFAPVARCAHGAPPRSLPLRVASP